MARELRDWGVPPRFLYKSMILGEFQRRFYKNMILNEFFPGTGKSMIRRRLPFADQPNSCGAPAEHTSFPRIGITQGLTNSNEIASDSSHALARLPELRACSILPRE